MNRNLEMIINSKKCFQKDYRNMKKAALIDQILEMSEHNNLK